MPREPLAVSIGSSVSESGAGEGLRVMRQLAVITPARAVIVIVVSSVTAVVWIGNPPPRAPAGGR